MSNLQKILILPGNGGSNVEQDNWYPWLRSELTKLGYDVTMTNMPDPVAAHMSIWLPYIEQELVKNSNTIIVGHSSGAVATLRYLENHRLTGTVLIGCNYTDLGFEDEKAAGWYDAPWQWDKIKQNAGWIVQLHGSDDPYFDTTEPKYIQSKLDSELIVLPGRGHFMTEQNPDNSTFPEVVEIIQAKTHS